ncbi:MAG: glycosyltransferase family 4 protein [Pseudomonadota bacterium]
MAKKKVIFLASFLNVAGAQEAALRVARSLRERDYETEVWFLYAEAKPAEIDPGVRILLDVTKPTARQYLTIARKLFVELRRARPDALVSFLPLANVLGQSLALLAGVRRRIASHRAPYWTGGAALRHADTVIGTLGVYSSVIAVAEEVRRSYDRHPRAYKKRIGVVCNGIDWTPSSLTRNEARRKFGLPDDRFVALTIGRMKPQKNYPFVVRIAEGLQSGMIVAAGDGPLWDEVNAMIERTDTRDRLHLLGAVAKSDIPDLFRAADTFILPSLYEGQSNALLEAMHDGTPVIVSERPEQRETVVEPNGMSAGVILDLDDPALWSRTIDDLAGDPERSAALGAAAKARSAAFSLDRQTDGFADVIEGRTPPPSSAPAGSLVMPAEQQERA